MIGVNKVILVGNVGANPEMRGDEDNVATFRLATNSQTIKDGEKTQFTEWHNVVAFGNLAGIIKSYLKKGRPVYLEGRLHTRSYEKEGEGKKFFTEVIANNIQFLDSAATNSSETPTEAITE